MIPDHIQMIVYGFGQSIPVGGFPTLGYQEIMSTFMRKRTIFPVGTSRELLNRFHKIQKRRWAFKRLLLFWNQYRFKDAYGNTEDLIGNSFEDSNCLSLWDWRCNKYYRFTKEDIEGHCGSKLRDNFHPTNPYINLPFTLGQITRINEYIRKIGMTDRSICTYMRWGGSLYFNTQVLMDRDGFPSLTRKTPCTNAERILLREITGVYVDLPRLDEMMNVLFSLLINEYSTKCLIPDTKIERVLYSIYSKWGIQGTIRWVQNWCHINRTQYQLKSRPEYKTFFTIKI